jgi:hypothetical protein
MKKLAKLPRELATDNGGLPADLDVEGHGQKSPDAMFPRLPGTGGESLAPGMPGTGGDAIRRPVGGGEVGDDGIEGSGSV